MTKISYLFCSLILPVILAAQVNVPDTVINLNTVTISGSREEVFAAGQSHLTIDSLARIGFSGGNLPELISGSSSIFFKSYSPASLITISLRGTSANHTGLLWNGIRISPPNIGYIDLSLVPVDFFNDISVLYGGTSPFFGSGFIGGSLLLNNQPFFEYNGFKADAAVSVGSFHNIGLQGDLEIPGRKIYSRTSLICHSGRNDFKYSDLYGEEKKLEHAEMNGFGAIQDLAVRLPRDQYLMGSVWIQYADRNIPPTMTEAESVANQVDRSVRSMLRWKDYNRHNSLEAKLAYFNEFTRYNDSLTGVHSIIRSQTVTAAFESSWDIFRNSKAYLGTSYILDKADLDAYENPRQEQNLSFYASFMQPFDKMGWKMSLNVRKEFLTSYKTPFVFSTGFEGRLWKILSMMINVSRNFRAPTMNERFWIPGGNPELQPETSWNVETGLVINQDAAHLNHHLRLTAFSSWVDNWILWLPDGNYWSVENSQKVWARGIECEGNQQFKISILNIVISESYSYTLSTNEVKQFDLDASYKKQLIYTPIHKAMLRAAALYRGFCLIIANEYTGEIFTLKDNSASLPGYYLLNVTLGKTFKIHGNYPLEILLKGNNIFNKEYQSVPYRPMPGINFLASVKFTIQSKEKKNE